jgi:hypothetical protein
LKENITMLFQGRNALPLTINQPNNGTIPKSSSTDESQFSQNQYKHNSQNDKNLSTTTTTSSSGIHNDQQSLLKQSSRKNVRISNQSTYRHSLLEALNPTANSLHQITPIKTLPKMIHLSENDFWSAKDALSSESKCLMLTQKMINVSTGEIFQYKISSYVFILLDNNNRCKSTPPTSNRPFSSERKSSTEDNFRQLLQEQSSKDLIKPSHSLSTTNEETISSFSGWDDPPSSSLPINSEQQQEPIQQTSPPPIVDSYYSSRPSDVSFTVNMTTSDAKSTVSTVTSRQQQINSFQPIPFSLARKLIAETSESEMSVQHEPWTRNIVYQSKDLQRTRLSSSYNNLSK